MVAEFTILLCYLAVNFSLVNLLRICRGRRQKCVSPLLFGYNLFGRKAEDSFVKIKTYIIYLLVLAAVITALLLVPRFAKIEVRDILEYTPKSPWLAALVLVGIYVFKVFLLVFPIVVLYVVAGMLFPTAQAFLVTIVGLLLALSLGFWLGRWLGRERLERLVGSRIRDKEGLPGSAAERRRSFDLSLCFFSRLSPIPFDLMNMYLGASTIRFGQYLGLSLLGLMPIMIPLVLMGESITDPLSADFLIPFGISVMISVTTFVLYRRWEKRRRNSANTTGDTDAGTAYNTTDNADAPDYAASMTDNAADSTNSTDKAEAADDAPDSLKR